jgi:hypothetical protein
MGHTGGAMGKTLSKTKGEVIETLPFVLVFNEKH